MNSTITKLLQSNGTIDDKVRSVNQLIRSRECNYSDFLMLVEQNILANVQDHNLLATVLEVIRVTRETWSDAEAVNHFSINYVEKTLLLNLISHLAYFTQQISLKVISNVEILNFVELHILRTLSDLSSCRCFRLYCVAISIENFYSVPENWNKLYFQKKSQIVTLISRWVSLLSIPNDNSELVFQNQTMHIVRSILRNFVSKNEPLQYLLASTIFDLFSTEDVSFTTGSLVTTIDNTVFVSFLTKGVSECSESVHSSVLVKLTLCLQFPSNPPFDAYIIAYMCQLHAAEYNNVLITAAEKTAEKLCAFLVIQAVAKSVFPVLVQYLIGYTHSEVLFHKCLNDLLPDDTSLLSLHKMKLIETLMETHAGYPEVYSQAAERLQKVRKNSKYKAIVLPSAVWNTGKKLRYSDIQSAYSSKSSRMVGLYNEGNTCFANSVLQSLFSHIQFTNQILSHEANDDKLLMSIQKLFVLLRLSKRPAIRATEVLRCSRPSWFATGAQQDSSEYLNHLLDSLHEKFVAKKQESPVNSIFRGIQCSKITCLSCNTSSSSKEWFYTLDLALPKEVTPISLSELLSSHFEDETLKDDNKYACDKCSSLEEAVRSSSITRMPSVVTISLSRFCYSAKTRSRQKLFHNVHIPENLTLSEINEKGLTRMDFFLSAVVVHSGKSLDSGHYYCFTLCTNTQNWYLLNDEKNTTIDFSSIQTLMDRFHADTPYLLMYSHSDFINNEQNDYNLSFLDKILAEDDKEYDKEQRSFFGFNTNKQATCKRDKFNSYKDQNDRDPPGSCGAGGGNFTDGPRFVC